MEILEIFSLLISWRGRGILTSSTFLHLGIAQARLALRSTSGTPEIFSEVSLLRAMDGFSAARFFSPLAALGDP